MRDADSIAERATPINLAEWGALLNLHRDRLHRVASFRIDPRLRGRIDAADVVQEVFVEAAEHKDAYIRDPKIPVFLWLRGILGNKLLELHRHHLGTHMRDARREVAKRSTGIDPTSIALIATLCGNKTGPATAVARDERRQHVQNLLSKMRSADREVLAMRHFEQLTNAEAAAILGIEERAAAKRYIRALERFKGLLEDLPGGLTGIRP